MPNFLSLLRKYSRFWAVLTAEVRSSLMNTEEFEVGDSLHYSSVDVYGVVTPPLQLPEVHDHLLSLADVERHVVILAPCYQAPYLISKRSHRC